MGVALAGYPPAFRVVGEVLGLCHHLYRLSTPLTPLLGRFQRLQSEGSGCCLVTSCGSLSGEVLLTRD